MTMPRGVLLDMGGVLLDMRNSRGFPSGKLDWRGRRALLKLLRGDGRRLSLDDLEEWVFEPWRHGYERRYERGTEESWRPYLRRLRQQTGSRRHDFTLLAAWFRPYGDHLEPCSGVEAALARLRRQGLRLAVVSNVPMPGRLYLKLLEAYGLAHYFDSFQFSYDCGSRKPSPAMLRLAMRELEVDPATAVMVGDRRASDVVAGRLAGTRTVWIRSEYRDGPRADHSLRSLTELPDLLADWG